MRSVRAVFWSSLTVLAYSYVGFPLLLLLRAALRPRPWDDRGVAPRSVTVVIAAHNEAGSIGAKLEQVLSVGEELAVDCVVASDGSTDSTVQTAIAAGDARVTVLDLPRSGKAAALNRAIAAATGDVIVFTDANSVLGHGALQHLLRPFADPEVGGVAGDQRYVDGDGAAAGERAYWDLDRVLKLAESRSGNVISATGALYAVRRELVRPVPGDVTDDFATSTGVIELGRRLVFAPDAVAYEPPASGVGGEYQRKVRVMTRGLRGVVLRRRLLDPRHSGFYAVQLWSHKVLRRLSVLPLLTLTASTVALRREGPVHRLAAVGCSTAVGATVTAVALSRTSLRSRRWVAIPAYFGMVNVAALQALYNVLTGRRIARWTPQRTGDG